MPWPPFSTASTRAEAVADLVAADSEAAVRAAAAGLSGALSAKVRALEEPLRALHADPSERYQTVSGMLAALAPILKGRHRMWPENAPVERRADTESR